MRASTAYFAGAGTVVAAIAAGLGGGLLIANIVSPTAPRQAAETTHLERRMSPAPVQATTAPSEPVPYLAAPQPSAPSAAVAAAPAQAPAPTEPVKQTEQVNAAPATPPAANTNTATAPAAPAAQSAPPSAPPSTSAAQEQRIGTSEDAFAKAREADVRRDADGKRAVDKRKFERRQHWADKRRYRQRQDQELQAVEQSVREETEPRREREFGIEPVRIEMPQIRLFGPE
jgi:hypothetical protein